MSRKRKPIFDYSEIEEKNKNERIKLDIKIANEETESIEIAEKTNKDSFDNTIKIPSINPQFKVIVSSCKDTNINPESVLLDDEEEWVSNGDHKNAWIRLNFNAREISTIFIADRVSSDNSMISGTIQIFNNNKEVKNFPFDGLPGDSRITEIKLDNPVYADSILLKAGIRVWGKNIGLRHLGVK